MLRRCTDHLTENAEHQAVAVLGIALTNIGTFVFFFFSVCECDELFVPLLVSSLLCSRLSIETKRAGLIFILYNECH